MEGLLSTGPTPTSLTMLIQTVQGDKFLILDLAALIIL